MHTVNSISHHERRHIAQLEAARVVIDVIVRRDGNPANDSQRVATALNAGRYVLACVSVCWTRQSEMHIPFQQRYQAG